jgi:hypothetical protein
MGTERRVRPVPPLVFGSLDVAAARDRWMEGVQQQGKTEALHVVVQFPTASRVETEKGQQAMMQHAIRFVNEYHGGDAVFAARLDRDEEGRRTVDVFAMPRYDFTYKDGRTQKRASVSKFSKEQAEKRFGRSDPRAQGSALQDAWHEYLTERCRLSWVEPPIRKQTRSQDRLEPEEYKQQQDRRKLDRRTKELNEREAALVRDARVVEAARKSAQKPPDRGLSAIAARGRRGRKKDPEL